MPHLELEQTDQGTDLFGGRSTWFDWIEAFCGGEGGADEPPLAFLATIEPIDLVAPFSSFQEAETSRVPLSGILETESGRKSDNEPLRRIL